MTDNPEFEHRDRLGRLIQIGDFVVAAGYNRLEVGIVCKLNPKMIQFKAISNSKYAKDRRVNKYPYDTAVIFGLDVTMFLVKNAT
jgi:hypothetical protein